MDAGDTHTYTVTISGGQQVNCGFGASAGAGELSVAQAGTQIFNGDATHSAPRPVDGFGECAFLFDWTAPYQVDPVTLYAAGNSVDGNVQTTGDQAASDGLVVTVAQPPPGFFPPVADAGGPYGANEGDPIDFDGTASSDPDGNIVFYEWDFGDSNTGSGPQPSHTYAGPGEYTVTLTVIDATTLEDADTTTARVLVPGNFAVKRLVKDLVLHKANYVTAPVGDERTFVVIKSGAGDDEDFGFIYIVEPDGTILMPPYLKIPVANFGAESGLRGLLFAPDYATSGVFYVIYSDETTDTVLSRFLVSANPNLADASSELEILRIPQPGPVHNTSHMEFGPDGKLYVAVGDGGEPDNGQDTSNILGSIIRIVPDPVAGGYTIPADNPFVGPGDPVDEIYAYGFRNPFVFDFDRWSPTDDVYIADVGGGRWEEVNVTPFTQRSTAA